MPRQQSSREGIAALAFAVVALVVTLAACSSRAPDAGGDTALAHDLARVQLRGSDTMYRAGRPAPDVIGAVPAPAAPESASAAGVAAPAFASAFASASPESLAVPAPDTAAPECAAAGRTAQSACFRKGVASSSARLDHAYQSLLTALRPQPGPRARAKRRGDPPAVRQLRAAQRAWLALRERECRRREQGRSPSLWAASRAQCFAELSTARANELDATLARIRDSRR